MRIFLAGGTGVLGVQLVPLLVEAGHEVVGTTRTAAKADIPDDGPKVGVDHAAAATVAHLTSPTGIYTVVD